MEKQFNARNFFTTKLIINTLPKAKESLYVTIEKAAKIKSYTIIMRHSHQKIFIE